jgi:hypothetical protein
MSTGKEATDADPCGEDPGEREDTEEEFGGWVDEVGEAADSGSGEECGEQACDHEEGRFPWPGGSR